VLRGGGGTVQRVRMAVVIVGLIFGASTALALAGSASLPASSEVAKSILVVAVTGQGKVTSSPTGIACPSKCRASFRVGARVRLAPHPATDWKFSRWIGACSTAGACAIRLKSSKAVRAIFTKIPVPKPPPVPPAPGTSRSNPYPLGTDGRVLVEGKPWLLRVNSVTPDATAAVLAANQFNDPPLPGRQFFMMSLTYTYQGSGSTDAALLDFDLRAVGASNVSYTTFGTQSRCGVLPDPDLILSTIGVSVFTGGSVTGNDCFSVLSGDVSSLVLYQDNQPTGQVWFALR